jgi:hypothetical protein
MRVAYVIAAHRYLDQVERLVRRLARDDTSLVVHVDRRAGKAPFDELRDRTSDLSDLHYLPRHLGYWGGTGLVHAALKGIADLLRNDVPFDYVVLLSGQDYPLRPAGELHARLDGVAGMSFMESMALPFGGWGARGGLDRVEDWHLVSRIALHIRLPRKRRIPGGLTPFGGSSWWCLSRPVATYVDGFARDNPQFVRFFDHALHASELFFQTLLLNSPHREEILNENLHFLVWRGGASPATLTQADLPELLASNRFFGRKFDTSVDSQVLDLLDAELDREHVVHPG